MTHPGIELINTFMRAVEPTEETIEERRAGMVAVTAGLVVPTELVISEAMVGDRPAEWLTPVGKQPPGVVLYLHGGAYCLGGIETHRSLAGRLAVAAQLSVCVIDYRLAPEHPFPAALDDALAAFRDLVAQGIRPDRIAIAGDSAGGGLTLATLVALRDAGADLPAAGVALSPWTDLTQTADSYVRCADVDPVIDRDRLQVMADAYLGGASPTSPLASPLFADLAGLPPLLVEVGEAECLLDDAVVFAERARAVGVDVTLNRYPELIHVFQAFPPELIPEGDVSLRGIGAFINDRFG